MSFLASVAWRNLWRHRRRSLITASAMAVGVGLCMAMIAYTDGMYDLIFRVLVEQQLGHVQVHHPAFPGRRQLYDAIPEADRVVERIERVPFTEVVMPRLFGAALLGGDSESTGVILRGVDPGAEALGTRIDTHVIAGSWLAAEAGGGVVIGVGVAEKLDVALGDELVAVTQAADGSIGNALYRVSGILESGNTAMDRGGAFLHLEDLRALLQLHGHAHEITIVALDADALDAYAAEVTAALEDVRVEDDDGAQVPVLVQPWWTASPPTAQMMALRDASAFIVLAIVFSVAAFGVLNTMMMSVFERTRELGVLKAIGLRPGRLVVMIVLESVFLAGLAVALGLVLGGVLDALLVVYGLDLGGQMEDGFTFQGVTIDPVIHGVVRPAGIVWTALAVFVVSVLASLWPAWRAARLDPVHAIRSE